MFSEEFAAQNRDGRRPALEGHRIGRVTYVSVYNDHLFDETLLADNIEPWMSDHGQIVAAIELEDVAYTRKLD